LHLFQNFLLLYFEGSEALVNNLIGENKRGNEQKLS
jgi:hypothetical protein